MGCLRGSRATRFQSTLSLRRATLARMVPNCAASNFNPRSPCGERPIPGRSENRPPRFQSTLSLRRATRRVYPKLASCCRFQSTLSLRRATTSLFSLPTRFRYFNPRSPCGERPGIRRPLRPDQARFQSTLSLRRATIPPPMPRAQQQFQSTLSLRRATRCLEQGGWGVEDFNPRSPCGERRDLLCLGHIHRISIHALLAESDVSNGSTSSTIELFQSTLSLRRATRWAAGGKTGGEHISIHALLAESDVHLIQVRRGYLDFNPRSPCGERREPDP